MVKYLDKGGHEIKWVYDSIARIWVKNPASDIVTPVPFFLAQPCTGPQPLNVWFTDLSILSSAVTWNLGDGTTSNNRSLLYTYNNGGNFTVTQGATNPYLTLLTTQTINVQDITPPAGTVLINGGATYTKSTWVTLNVSATGTDPGSRVRFSNWNDGTWTGWCNLADRGWTLLNGAGRKDVWYQFKDGAGNLSQIRSASIFLDTIPPDLSVSINGEQQYTSTTAAVLFLHGGDNWGGSGISGVRFGNMALDPLTQQWWVPLWTSWLPYEGWRYWTLPSGSGEKRVAVQIRDDAGWITEKYDSIILDTSLDGQYGISINGGAAVTTSPQVTLNVSVNSPESGLQMRFVNGDYEGPPEPDSPYWSAWEPLAPNKNWVLDGGDERGNCFVWSQFKGSAGILSGVRGAQIMLDTSPPFDGVLTATGGDRQVTLSWSGFNDEVSRIKTFRLYCSTKPTIPDLNRYTLIYQSLDNSFVHQNLKKGNTYYYWIVAEDEVGHTSAGVRAQATTKGIPLPLLPLLLQD